MPGLYSHVTRSTGTVLTAVIYNGDHQSHIDNAIPQQHDDYSSNATQMQATTDPGENTTESLAISTAGELERLRFIMRELKGTPTQWYTSGWEFGGIKDVSNNELLSFAKVASAVNEFKITNAATGTSPLMEATGGDADISFRVRPKGTSGKVVLEDHNGNELMILGPGVANAVNEFKITNAAAGVAPSLEATGEANVSFDIKPKGTGLVRVTDGADPTKKVSFDASAVATGTVRKLTVPNHDVNLDFVAQIEGHIYGLTTSNNAVDAVNDIDIAAGIAVDDSEAVVMRLSSILVKRIDAAWAVGTNQGGMDTGTVADNTWYYVWLIRRSDTGVVDALFSLSSTAPTMPTNYNQKRLIGAVRRGTATNLAFYQDGDFFKWQAKVAVLNAGTATTDTAVTLTPAVPPIAKSFSAYARATGDTTTDIEISNECVVQVAAGVDFAGLAFTRESDVDTIVSGAGGGITEVPNTGVFNYRNQQSNTTSRNSSIWITGFKLAR